MSGVSAKCYGTKWCLRRGSNPNDVDDQKSRQSKPSYRPNVRASDRAFCLWFVFARGFYAQSPVSEALPRCSASLQITAFYSTAPSAAPRKTGGNLYHICYTESNSSFSARCNYRESSKHARYHARILVNLEAVCLAGCYAGGLASSITCAIMAALCCTRSRSLRQRRNEWRAYAPVPNQRPAISPLARTPSYGRPAPVRGGFRMRRGLR